MSKHTIRQIVFCWGAAAFFYSAHSVAESQENRLEQARKQMELGQEAFHQKKFSEAAEYFESAFEASPFAAFMYNAGLAYERDRNPKRAVELYRRYLKMEPEASDASKIREKIDLLSALFENTDTASKQPAAKPEVSENPEAEVEMKSLISVRTNPKEATIRILNATKSLISSAAAPLAQTVERGTYIVEASHPDYRTVSTEISVAPGQVYVVVVEMSQGAFLGFLKVITDIPGAAVFIDSREAGQVGTTPFGNVIPVGKHRLWVEKPGYVPIEQEVDIALSEEQELTMPLQRFSFGALKVKTNIQNAEVFVDGKSAGMVDDKACLIKLLPSGKHHVRIAAEDMKDYEMDAAIEGGKETKLLIRMNPKPGRTSGYVSAGFSLALFGAGGAFGGIALHRSKSLDADRKAGRLAADDPRIMQGFLWAVGADTSFAVATIIAGMSLYYFLRDPLPPSEGKATAPTDFTENPKDGPAAPKPKSESADSAKSARSYPKPKWLLSPVLGQDTAGVGFQWTF